MILSSYCICVPLKINSTDKNLEKIYCVSLGYYSPTHSLPIDLLMSIENKLVSRATLKVTFL